MTTTDYKRINNDSNGNPRYVVHFLSLGLASYPDITPKHLTKLGLSKYRGKDFGGGYVFTSYNVEGDIEYFINKILDHA